MALPGPAADPRSGNGHTTAEWDDVPDVPFVHGRALPTYYDWPWHPAVEKWFEVVASMPHAVRWREADWLAVNDLALLKHRQYEGTATTGDIVEIRRREDQLGTTAEARRKLRIRYTTPRSETAATPAGAVDAGASVTPITSARDRLRGQK